MLKLRQQYNLFIDTGMNMIKKCLFPAAGYGTRFLPATKSMPKEMMPIVNKPLIEYGVEEAIQAGMNGMCIVTGRGKHSIMDHFDKNYELEHQISGTNKEDLLIDIRDIIDKANFTYIRQCEMKGLGHAILTGRELVVAVQEVPADETHKYGVISGEMIKDNIYRVEDMVEKPEQGTAPSNLAIIGRYILTPDIFELIENTQPGKGGEIQITDALLKQAQAGCVLAYKFKGNRFDCGSVEGYIEATNYCFENLYLKDTKKSELGKQSTTKEI